MSVSGTASTGMCCPSLTVCRPSQKHVKVNQSGDDTPLLGKE